MGYPEFREEILCVLQKIVPKELELRAIEAEKNNGCIRYGISFGKTDMKYIPTVYLEPFYRSFLEGKSIDALAKELMTCYKEEIENVPGDVERLQHYETACPDIYCKLLHLEENQHLLLDTPYLIFLDFAVVAYYEIDSANKYKGSVLIKDYLLDFWNITREQLFKDSLSNTYKHKRSYFSTMSDFVPQEIFKDNDELQRQVKKGMFILTNTDRYLGSVLVYFPEVLKRIAAELGEDFYMLPSSIHEWIIMPVSISAEPDFLLRMVRDVNQNEVLEEEVLSNNIYFYSIAADGNKITCISTQVS